MLTVSYFLKLQRQPFLSRFLNFSRKKEEKEEELRKITKNNQFLDTGRFLLSQASTSTVSYFLKRISKKK